MSGSQQSAFAAAANKISGGKMARAAGGLAYVQALNEISLDIGPGDRVGLIGRNGAGKSTMLKMLAGLLPPSSGILEVDGKTTNILALGLGMDPDQTGYENVRRMCRLLQIPRKLWDDIEADVEEFAALDKFMGLPLRTYSAGMSIRLSFGMATAYPRDILIIDEVIGAGDMYFMAKAQARIEKYIEKARILVLATHSHGVLQHFCNRVLYLKQGRIAYDGTPDDAWNAYAADGGDT